MPCLLPPPSPIRSSEERLERWGRRGLDLVGKEKVLSSGAAGSSPVQIGPHTGGEALFGFDRKGLSDTAHKIFLG